MKRLLSNDMNPNGRKYWNHVYGTPEQRAGYAEHGTPMKQAGVVPGRPTGRFTKALEQIKDGDKVIDLGCGVGVFTKLVKDTYPKCEVWGIDISDQVISDNKTERTDIYYQTGAIGGTEMIPLDSYDVVFSGETLEHLDEPRQLFVDAHQYLKPGGRFVLTTPKGENIQSPEHMWAFDHDDIESLYLGNGFDRVEFIYLPDMEHFFVIMAVGTKK